MRTTLAPLLLLLACGHTESGTDHDSHDTGTTHHDHTTTTGTTTGTTDTSTGSTTHAHETDEHASDTHEHEPTSTTHEHTTGDTTTGGSPAADYCDCMLVNCHDQYHGTWGEEHPMSETNCRAAAEMVPTVGMPAMSGNSLECRLWHCEMAASDESLCEGAIGNAPCM